MAGNFSAELEIIVGNPYVSVPPEVLQGLFDEVGRDTGPIPIRGTINGKQYQQTLVKYSGAWRLYVNISMLKNSPKRIGETVEVTVAFDPSDRTIDPPLKFVEALAGNREAAKVFHSLSPSRQKEIVRYISTLKSEAAVERNVERAINFLLGNGRFVGRDGP